jgi:DNA-binding IclR family transcriptional regulator
LHDDIGAGRPWVVNAAVPIGTDAVVIARFLSPSAPVDTVVKAGTRLPLGGSALGRSMLAFLGDDACQGILGPEGATRFAERAELIRRRGGLDVAVDEIRPGISAIAVAVRTEGHQPVASLGISGPSKLLPLHPNSDLCGRLRRAAARVADEAPQTAPPWRLNEPTREPAPGTQ